MNQQNSIVTYYQTEHIKRGRVAAPVKSRASPHRKEGNWGTSVGSPGPEYSPLKKRG
jgi:hypothetical protein